MARRTSVGSGVANLVGPSEPYPVSRDLVFLLDAFVCRLLVSTSPLHASCSPQCNQRFLLGRVECCLFQNAFCHWACTNPPGLTQRTPRIARGTRRVHFGRAHWHNWSYWTREGIEPRARRRGTTPPHVAYVVYQISGPTAICTQLRSTLLQQDQDAVIGREPAADNSCRHVTAGDRPERPGRWTCMFGAELACFGPSQSLPPHNRKSASSGWLLWVTTSCGCDRLLVATH